MCGIVGAIGVEIDPKTINNALDSIKHRGPDNSGYWQDYASGVWIGHTRLSIIDLSDRSDQPMHDRTGRYVISYNGEIYNYLELRTELEIDGHIFETDSDTEVLLKGLISYGFGFLHRCNGMWAFFLWDRHQKVGYMARDRFGVKPLYYAASVAKGSLFFASEMKGISSMTGDRHLVEDFVDLIDNPFLYEGTDYCIYKGIRRLPPGCCGTFREGVLKIERWWETLDHIHIRKASYADQCEEWKSLFLDSTRIRLRSDVPIGVALSGGLDSSSVLAAISSISPSSSMVWKDELINAYCSSFPGSSNDETAWARLAAGSTSTSLEEISFDRNLLQRSLLKDIAMVEDPYLTIPTPMIQTYRRVKESGVKISIDGHGSDELFSGYGHLVQALRCTNRMGEMAEILKIDESTRTGIYSKRERLRVRDIARKKLLLILRDGMKSARALTMSYFEPGNRGAKDAWNERLLQVRRHERYGELDVLSQALYEIFHVSFLPTLLRNYDRYSMSSGIELRMPFLDWRLVTFTFGLPWHAKVGGTFTKRIQRDSLKGILVDEIRLRRDKIGWNAPIHQWFQDKKMELLLREISDRCSDHQLRARCREAMNEFYAKGHPSFYDGEILWRHIQPTIWLAAQN